MESTRFPLDTCFWSHQILHCTFGEAGAVQQAGSVFQGSRLLMPTWVGSQAPATAQPTALAAVYGQSCSLCPTSARSPLSGCSGLLAPFLVLTDIYAHFHGGRSDGCRHTTGSSGECICVQQQVSWSRLELSVSNIDPHLFSQIHPCSPTLPICKFCPIQ